jgi:hypothetical protein
MTLRHVWITLAAAWGALLVIVIVLFIREGAFDSPASLDERARSLEPGALDAAPFADGGVAELEEYDEAGDSPSIGVRGVARIAVENVTVLDKQGRKVLHVGHARTSVRLGALQDGTFRVPGAEIDGADIYLYRDATGQLSIVNALKSAPPSVRRSLSLPPREKAIDDEFAMEVRSVALRNTTLTIGFTDKPIKFRVDRGKVRIQQEQDEEEPRVYFDYIEGAMLEPSPLPKPVRIAYARGLVRLEGGPLVELVARTCVGLSELRVKVVVPARKQQIQLTADSFGIGGALGRLGMKIAAKRKSGQLAYDRGAVRVNAGRGCRDSPTQDPPEEAGEGPREE